MGCCLQHVPLPFKSFLGPPKTPHQLFGSLSFQAPQNPPPLHLTLIFQDLTLVNTCPFLLLQLKLLRENHHTNAGGVTRHSCQFHLGFQCYLLGVPGKLPLLLSKMVTTNIHHLFLSPNYVYQKYLKF